MNDESSVEAEKARLSLADKVGAKATRKLKARREPTPGVWFGLGMMGLIGWAVAVPTLFGAAVGHWLDRHHTSGHSWTLALLSVGLVLGCLNAWHWVSSEDRAMHEQPQDDVSDATQDATQDDGQDGQQDTR